MRITHFCLSFLAFAIAVTASAQTSFWTKLDEKSLSNRSSERWIVPEKCQTFALDATALRNSLYDAPLRDEPGKIGTTLEIPMPDGSTEFFEIWDAPLMHPDLASRFRNIKTFSGQGITNPNSAIYLDWTPQGFHAMIIAPGKVSFIDPYFMGDNSVYAVYDRQDYSDATGHEFSCGAESDEEHQYMPSFEMSPIEATNRVLTTKRTYRLAIAASGEYSSYHGGTKELALAAINTTLNRVRGIYETELGISFTLISNNADIIYLDSTTDPYSLPPTLAENQTNIDLVIGSANYDMGHVFGAGGGGGIATVSSVCNNASKARGMTAAIY
ncbi:MAG: hypothetical protein IT258_00915, partial [Saprospiraceae bacterium]|nr:hypothetical protein [Saprospiraceae bacterium]